MVNICRRPHYAQPSYLTETPPCVWVAHVRRDAALVAVTWPAVRVAMVTGGTPVALPTSNPRLATAKTTNNEA